MLHIGSLTSEQWIAKCPGTKFIQHRLDCVDKLNIILRKLRSRFSNGSFLFGLHEHSTPGDRVLTAIPTSPLFNMLKFLPHPSLQLNDHWKSASIDHGIVDIFISYNLNSYGNTKSPVIETPYIFFPLQDISPETFCIKTLAKVLHWSKTNKKTIVFKTHPLIDRTNRFFELWDCFETLKHTTHAILLEDNYEINNLIANSQAVWSFNSGVALSAILMNKPTVSFLTSDYNPICQKVTTPEEASAATLPKNEDVMRFLSWFYYRYTIDLDAENAEKRFDNLFKLYYDRQISYDEILRLDWKT